MFKSIVTRGSLLSICFLGLGLGCAKFQETGGEGGGSVTECVLPEEQRNSLQGSWEAIPIKVSFHAGDFSGAETSEIVAGGDVWNSHFTIAKGGNILDLGGGTTSLNQTIPNCTSSATIPEGVVVYKRFASWAHSTSAVAVTTMCFNPAIDGGLNKIFNAILEFNYVNFFVDGTGKFPDIQSIAVHEFGHLVGLDHSCGNLVSGLPNVGCPDAGSDPNNFLVEAVMFPQVFFDPAGNGEIKRILKSNDQGRANCLY